MAKRNSVILKSFRIPAEMDDILLEIAEELLISKTNIIRLVLNRGLMQLKYDSTRMGGYQNLNFSLERIK